MAFNIILEALTLAMHRLESLSDLAVRLQRLALLDAALIQEKTLGIQGFLGVQLGVDWNLLLFLLLWNLDELTKNIINYIVGLNFWIID